MANYGPSSAFLLVGGNNMSGESTFSLEEDVSQLTSNVRGIGDTMEAYKPVGVGMVELSAQPGLYTDDAFKQVSAYESNQSTKKLVSYGVEGLTRGQNAVMMNGLYTSKWKRLAQRDGLTLAGAEFTVTGDYYRGIIIGANEAAAGDGDSQSNSVDNGAASNSGIIVDIHVSALDLDGGSGLDVDIDDSPDNSIWSTLGSFTTITDESNGTAERITVAGTIDRYLSISWTFTGGSSPTATIYVVAYRN